MLDVPKWPDSAMLPKDPTVVRALNVTARGVLVSMTAPTPASLRSRNTR